MAPLNMNKKLDGSTYPGLKMSCFTCNEFFLMGEKRSRLRPVTPTSGDGASFYWGSLFKRLVLSYLIF